MSTDHYAARQPAAVPEFVGLGLLGAGALILVAQSPQAREAVGRFISSPEVREIGDEFIASVGRLVIQSLKRIVATRLAE